jgi:hypothetical protein
MGEIKTLKGFGAAAQAYDAARESAAKFNKVREEYAELLKNYLKSHKLQSVTAGQYRVSLAEVTNKKIDFEKLKSEHPRIKFSAYEMTVGTERLSVRKAE